MSAGTQRGRRESGQRAERETAVSRSLNRRNRRTDEYAERAPCPLLASIRLY